MSNPNGKKGAAFERLTADCLSKHLEPELTDPRDRRIDRRVKTGAKDRGDIAGVRMLNALGSIMRPMPRVVVEVKNVTRLNLGGWVDEAEVERGNDDALIGVVIHKRRGHGDPLDQYVTCTVRDLIALLTGERPD